MPLIVLASVALAALNRPPAHDRRVVDIVTVGDAASETLHGYVGHEDSVVMTDGVPSRHVRGSVRYTLLTFDDTDVTIACTFVGMAAGAYDIVVEDSLIASKRYDPTSPSPVTVDALVPFALTKGKTTISVTLRARGGPIPLIRELRSVQDHNEVSFPSGAVR